MKLAAHTDGGGGPAGRGEGSDGGGGVGSRGLEESFVAGAALGGAGVRTAGEASAAPVESAMSAPVITVDPLYTAGRALAVAERHGIAHLPIAWSDGEILGIVCVCDLWPLASGELVVHHMSLPVVAVGPRDTLARAAELMRENDVGSLPVIDRPSREGAGTLPGFPSCGDVRLVGMLTVGDLARAGVLAVDELPQACMCCGSRHHVRIGVPVGTARSSSAFCLRCMSLGDGELSSREGTA